MKKMPDTVVGLIELLDEENPPKPIGRQEPLEDAHRRAGRVELVDELKRRYAADLKSRTTELTPVLRKSNVQSTQD